MLLAGSLRLLGCPTRAPIAQTPPSLDQRQIGEDASVNPHLPRHAQLTPLTGIRGAAAVWVVAFHAYPLVGSLFGWPERWRVLVVRDGFLAVDLFFVLSGFVLSVAYNERLRS